VAEERSFEPQSYAEPEAADDLPPPAYRPAPPQARVEQPEAPSRTAPGTPTPEALARLRAMASRAAESRATEPQRPSPAGAAPQGEKPRFGINSLINRMTGQPGAEAPPAAAVAGAPAPRAQPQPRYEAQPDAEQERADIPAFLRRQAN
jgi:cell division protein FtsZ